MSSFRLIHRTDHQGLFINPADIDQEVPLDVIWTQAVWRGSYGCCPGFGSRIVVMEEEDFCYGLGDWYLHYVSDTEPYESHHAFLKFVLCRRHENRPGWRLLAGGLHSNNVLRSLRNILGTLLSDFRRGVRGRFFHFHVGIEMDRAIRRIDTLDAEDEYYEEMARESSFGPEDAIEEAHLEKGEEEARVFEAIESVIEDACWDKWEEEGRIESDMNEAIEEAYWGNWEEEARIESNTNEAIEYAYGEQREEEARIELAMREAIEEQAHWEQCEEETKIDENIQRAVRRAPSLLSLCL